MDVCYVCDGCVCYACVCVTGERVLLELATIRLSLPTFKPHWQIIQPKMVPTTAPMPCSVTWHLLCFLNAVGPVNVMEVTLGQVLGQSLT